MCRSQHIDVLPWGPERISAIGEPPPRYGRHDWNRSSLKTDRRCTVNRCGTGHAARMVYLSIHLSISIPLLERGNFRLGPLTGYLSSRTPDFSTRFFSQQRMQPSSAPWARMSGAVFSTVAIHAAMLRPVVRVMYCCLHHKSRLHRRPTTYFPTGQDLLTGKDNNASKSGYAETRRLLPDLVIYYVPKLAFTQQQPSPCILTAV